MMGTYDCLKLLQQWEKEYSLPDDTTEVVFMGFTVFEDPKLLGRTLSYYPAGKHEIYLSANRLDKDWKIKAVLWHEFCHCCLPTSEGHGTRFWRMMFRKPLLAIMDLIL